MEENNWIQDHPMCPEHPANNCTPMNIHTTKNPHENDPFTNNNKAL
jgi:hypothetical protein